MAEGLTLSSGGWRFAAHLGISDPGKPLLARIAASLDPVDQIACAADLGFAGISDNGLTLRDPETQRRMGRALRDHGLEMGSFTAGGLGNAALSDALAAAERIGGGCVNMVLLDAGTEPARAADALGRAAETVFAAGFRLAVEAVSRARVPGSLIERGEDAAALIRASGSPHLGLILDSCHCHIGGEDMAALIRRHAGRLAVVQIADMPGRVEPGAGNIDFAPVMAALAEIGWRGLVEAEFDPAGPDALAGLRRL